MFFDTARIGIVCDAFVGHRLGDDHNRKQSQDAGDDENARHTDPLIQYRPKNNRQRKRHADGRADNRHGFGAMFAARKIGRERLHHGGDRTRALNQAAKNNEINIVRHCGNETTDRKQDQTKINDRFAAIFVG